MDWYSVTIEFRAPEGGRNKVSEDAMDTLATLVEPHHGVASGGAEYDTYGATVSVTADDALAAAGEASRAVKSARRKAGLPAWPLTRADSVREDVLDEEQSTPNIPSLVSGPEAAGILGVTRQRLHHIAHTHEDFPRPLYQLSVGSLWDRRAVQRFAQEWERRPGRPRKAS